MKKKWAFISMTAVALACIIIYFGVFSNPAAAEAKEKGEIFFDDYSWTELVYIDTDRICTGQALPEFCFKDSSGVVSNHSMADSDYIFISPETGKQMTDAEIYAINGNPIKPTCSIADPDIVEFIPESAGLLAKKTGETTFKIEYQGNTCEIPISVRLIDPLDTQVLADEIEIRFASEELCVDEHRYYDVLCHEGLGNADLLSMGIRTKHGSIFNTPTSWPEAKAYVADEKIAKLTTGDYYNRLETLAPGETEIVVSYWGVERRFPLIVLDSTVESIYIKYGDEIIRDKGSITVSNSTPDTLEPKIHLMAVMSDGNEVDLMRYYATACWNSSDPAVAKYDVPYIASEKPGTADVTCSVFDYKIVLHVTVLP